MDQRRMTLNCDDYTSAPECDLTRHPMKSCSATIKMRVARQSG